MNTALWIVAGLLTGALVDLVYLALVVFVAVGRFGPAPVAA